MKPFRIEYHVGQTRHGQLLRFIQERGSDGVVSWTLRREAANQRDDSAYISGLTAEAIERMAEAVRSTK